MSHDGTRRVLAVLHEPHFGGATLSVLRLVPLLEQRGWSFAFWAPAPGDVHDELRRTHELVGGALRYVHWDPYTLRLPPGPRARIASFPGYLRAYVRFLRRARPDLVHANTLTTLVEAGIARAAGRPTLLHLHEMIPEGPLGQVLPRAVRVAATEAVGVSAASAARLDVDGRRAEIVYESAPIPPERPPRPPDPDPIVVGTVGVVSARKGTDLFVEAAALVRAATGRRVEFRMVGADHEEDPAWVRPLMERARSLGIVHRYGIDVLEELRGWDVFVLPSRNDPFPIALLEAMASGLPVVGTRVDGIAEQITPEAGHLAPPEDPAELARAIVALVEDADARSRMGAAARERVIRNFTHEHQAAQLAAAYERTLGGGR